MAISYPHIKAYYVKIITLFVSFLLFNDVTFSQETRLLRFPSIHQDKIVFAYASDLWLVSKSGGSAQRLTSAPGDESNPVFSSDGKTIAFTAQYQGNFDVYTISTTGGEPRRLTWHPGADVVCGWSPDGKVVFSSNRESAPNGSTKLWKLGDSDGLPIPLPMPRASRGSYSPDGNQYAYELNVRWDIEWRNYRGGQNKPIWIQNLQDNTLKTIPMTNSHDMQPIWIGDKIYFLSDRDYAMNLYSYDTKSEAVTQLTTFSDFDIKYLAGDATTLIFEYGGDLYTYDIANKKYNKVSIEVKADFPWLQTKWVNVNDILTNGSLSPNGQRALFEARGEIITVPQKKGDARNLTNSTDVRDHDPIWSPDGKSIAWFSDKSGEYSLMVGSQDALTKPREIKIPNPTFYYSPTWSPDSKYIAFTDHIQQLWMTDISTGKTQLIDKEPYLHPERTTNPVWSPDSKYIAYARRLNSQYHVIMTYSVDQSKTYQLTDGMSDAIAPGWDAKGKYLYFLASTNYALRSGWLDMSSIERPIRRSVYFIVLKKGDPSPLLPESDEETSITKDEDQKDTMMSSTVKVKKDKTKEEGKDEEKRSKKDSAKVRVVIDLEGISQRILSLSMPPREYTDLKAGSEGELFITEAVQNQDGYTLHKYTFKERKSEVYLTPIQMYALSVDGKKLLYKSGNTWGIVDASTPAKIGDGSLNTSGIQIKIDPRKEWHQIYREAWRYQRDYLYVKNVHGADWDKVYQSYLPLVDHVAHRNDLNYLLDILGGEVSIGHSFVGGGDYPKIDKVKTGLLGADLEIVNNRYRIKKIYTGENWNPGLRAPLSTPGVDVTTGDYIIEVEGIDLKSPTNPFSLFENKADKQVHLTVSKNADGSNPRKVIVVPVESESALRTYDWVESNRRQVAALSNNQLAYVWLPNTAEDGYNNFNRYYFAQQDKAGVILDERYNGGGFIADYFVDVLNRQLRGYFNNVAGDHRPWTEPLTGIFGPKVMVVNEMAGSGGDMLPYLFKKMNIGPVVGTRTWGGLVGIWDTPELIDGGNITAPRGGYYNLKGEWDVENTGITPDIQVEMTPKEVIDGHDPQLEKAVETALNLLKDHPVKLEKEPEAPIRVIRPNKN